MSGVPFTARPPASTAETAPCEGCWRCEALALIRKGAATAAEYYDPIHAGTLVWMRASQSQRAAFARYANEALFAYITLQEVGAEALFRLAVSWAYAELKEHDHSR